MNARTLNQKHYLNDFSTRRCSRGCNLNPSYVLGLALCCILIAVAPSGAWAADKVALLLCVEDYETYGKSEIPSSTIVQMGQALSGHGFSVDVMTNANNAVARATLRDFAQKAEGAQVAIVVLAGHGVGAGGQFYLLPSNASIRRSSDLFSRALAVSSVARIAARAEHGAVFFFTSAADISSTLEGLSARAKMKTSPADNVVAVISTSDKVPVSRVGTISRQAAADFAEAAGETPLTMASLIAAASAGEVGSVYGTVGDLSLSKEPGRPTVEAVAPESPPVEPPEPPPQSGPTEAELAAARRDREKRVEEAMQRARDAEARARAAEARAKLETEKAREAQLAVATADAERREEAKQAAAAERQESETDVDSLKLVEALLGRSKKRLLQRKMRDLGHYNGPIDAIFGDLTRQAVRDYQGAIGQAVTGYLTPDQIRLLLES